MKTSLKSKFAFILTACILIGMLPGSAGRGSAKAENNLKDKQFEKQAAGTDTLEQGKIDYVKLEAEQGSSLRFAVIGDYGNYANDAQSPEVDVANLIKSWAPDIILTTGDNNYNDGTEATIDDNIGKFFHEFISPYQVKHGAGGQVNRFFPSLGNHDWHTQDVDDLPYPYLDYFTLPGNERYYDFTWGPVHFFALDSDSREPDGVGLSSVQASWLQSRLAASTSPWKIVFFHHAPYSSGEHGSMSWMQWPFAAWGADVVLSGHDHTYERISPLGDILYFVNGLGGKSIYDFRDEEVLGSQVQYNGDYGAMLVDVFIGRIRFQFINRNGVVIDDFSLVKQFEYSYLPILQKTSP